MSESKKEKRREEGGNKIKRNEGVSEKAVVSCLMKTCMYNMEAAGWKALSDIMY